MLPPPKMAATGETGENTGLCSAVLGKGRLADVADAALV